MSKECGRIVTKKNKNIDIESELKIMKARISKLEHSLEEKDSELRELSINSSVVMQHLNLLQNLIKKRDLELEYPGQIAIEQKQEEGGRTDIVNVNDGLEITKERKKSKVGQVNKKDSGDGVELIDPMRLEKMGSTITYTYRERMILMNRIDIYRLYVTVILNSSKLKYPRALKNIEERELKMFVEELSELENMVLDQKSDENAIWDKGKVCEKQILDLFYAFFNG